MLHFLSFLWVQDYWSRKTKADKEKKKLWISKSDCFSVFTEFLCFSFPQQLNRDHPWSLSESQSVDGGSLKDLCTSPDSLAHRDSRKDWTITTDYVILSYVRVHNVLSDSDLTMCEDIESSLWSHFFEIVWIKFSHTLKVLVKRWC